MSVFGITAVRLDQDGWVEAALIGEFDKFGNDFAVAVTNERRAGEIASMIKDGNEVYCIFGTTKELGPKFGVIKFKDGSEGIKLINDLPERGLQQLIQLEKRVEGQNNPLGSW